MHQNYYLFFSPPILACAVCLQTQVTECVVKNNKVLNPEKWVETERAGIQILCKHRQSNWNVTSELWQFKQFHRSFFLPCVISQQHSLTGRTLLLVMDDQFILYGTSRIALHKCNKPTIMLLICNAAFRVGIL